MACTCLRAGINTIVGVILLSASASAAPRAELVGIAIKSVTFANSHGVLANGPSGQPGMFYIPYYSTTGSELVGCNPVTGETVRIPLGTSGGYGCVVGQDGTVYVGGVGTGDLYRYDPATNEVSNLGGHELGQSYVWDLDLAANGKVYGSTYPTCEVIQYDPATAQVTSLGRVDPDEQYSRALCVDGRGRIWVGTGNKAHLVILDPATGERRDVLPEVYRGNSSVYNLHYTGRYVMATVLYLGSVLVFDAETAAVVAEIPQAEPEGTWMSTAGGAAERPYLYSLPSGDLYQYDVPSRQLTRLAEGLGQCEIVIDGRYVHGIDDQEYFYYDLQTRSRLVQRKLTEARDGMGLMTLVCGRDGNIYGATYINQHMFGYKPGSEHIHDLGKIIRIGGQCDSMHAGRDGRIYMGHYVRAHVSVYDPSRPWNPGDEPGSNPRNLGSVGHGQYRTQAITLGPDGNIWVGTIPSYNSAPTGAVSVVNPVTGERQTWTDLVPGGSVSRLAADDRYLYGAGGGEFFVWDAAARRKVWTEARPVSALLAAEGKVIGSGDGKVFVFDPEGLKVVAELPSSAGNIEFLAQGPGGGVYGLNAQAVVEIDFKAGVVRQVAAEGGSFLTVDHAGVLYFGRGAQVFRLRLGDQ